MIPMMIRITAKSTASAMSKQRPYWVMDLNIGSGGFKYSQHLRGSQWELVLLGEWREID